MRWYRALLRLYPASFRHEYGDEMTAIFRARRRVAGGALARLALGASALVEVAGNAATVHADLLRQDLRAARRSFLRAPAFTLTAIVVVALGVGANTAVFSVTDHALFRPLPFPDADRLLKLWERRPGYGHMELSPANYRDWKERSTTLETMAAYWSTAANLIGEGDPQRIAGARVESTLFPVLGVGPVLGRAFTEEDCRVGAAEVAILSSRLWSTRFGGDPSVLGRTISLDGISTTVVGVMPAGFLYPHRDIDYWGPARIPEELYEDRNNNFLEVVARLPPGVGVEQVRADLERVTAQLEQLHPVENEDAGATVYRLRDQYSRQSELLLLALAGAALCVLLIACVNLANLLMARALSRRRELLVRAALGAGRERLARQLLTEGLALALAGGALGVGLAAVALPLLARLVPSSLPIASAPTIDYRVLAGAALLTLAVGVAIGLFPVARLRRSGFSSLRTGERGGERGERLRSALVVASVACSVVLLVGAGLLLRALWRVQSVDPGFRTEGVLTLRTALPMPRYQASGRRVQWYRQIEEQLEALPGVSDASFISFLPMTMTGGIWPVGTDQAGGRREQGQVASLRFVTPGFFATLGVPLLEGRDVEWEDDMDRPFVAVVSESFAERYFPGAAPIGQRFELAFFEREIVGVASDVRVRGLEQPSEPQVYLPAGQVPDGGLPFYTPSDLAIRADIAPETLLAQVRAIVRRADPEQPISSVRTLAQIVEAQTASRAVQLRVVASFAGVAVLLAAIGIHGLLTFLVSQRRREIGVRVALGARRGDVVRMIAGRGALLAALGVAIGGALAYLAGRGLEAVLAGVPASDPLTFAAVAALCAAMTLAGSVAPALRALRVDPATAIRVD
ncbi:MAG TPA: ABC transporter permease [Thermoanaerobaculia bacterium]|nr:ABC transporter permease [Thermoanaerobaculia bacterium]